MTAGHCADGASSVNVMLGAHNVRETVEDGRLEIASNEIFTHENYNGLTIRNDVGLVHLPEPVQFTGEREDDLESRLIILHFTDWIRPICLPSYSEWNSTWYHLDMQISGWGKPTDQSDSISPVLRDATVDTITNLACALEFPLNINKNNICISGRNGISTCNVGNSFQLLKLQLMCHL